jgi:hypothetical protein
MRQFDSLWWRRKPVSGWQQQLEDGVKCMWRALCIAIFVVFLFFVNSSLRRSSDWAPIIIAFTSIASVGLFILGCLYVASAFVAMRQLRKEAVLDANLPDQGKDD